MVVGINIFVSVLRFKQSHLELDNIHVRMELKYFLNTHLPFPEIKQITNGFGLYNKSIYYIFSAVKRYATLFMCRFISDVVKKCIFFLVFNSQVSFPANDENDTLLKCFLVIKYMIIKIINKINNIQLGAEEWVTIAIRNLRCL